MESASGIVLLRDESTGELTSVVTLHDLLRAQGCVGREWKRKGASPCLCGSLHGKTGKRRAAAEAQGAGGAAQPATFASWLAAARSERLERDMGGLRTAAHQGKAGSQCLPSPSRGPLPTAEYYVLIALSCVIATLGLIQGSAAVIIGATTIAPLMTPILAFSLGVIWGDARLLRTSFSSVLKGAALAVAISAVLVYVVPISHFLRGGDLPGKSVAVRHHGGPGFGALPRMGMQTRKSAAPSRGLPLPLPSCRPCAPSAFAWAS